MGRNYFQDEDNFLKIIEQHLSGIKSVSQVQTGWTNYVYRVRCDAGVFYFRFPRNEFFSAALIKEYNIVNFVKDKISLKTPDFRLFYEGQKPYTVHPEIAGESLSQCYTSLTEEEKKQLAKDICELLEEFANIDLSQPYGLNFQPVSNFLDNLSGVSQNGYDTSVHNYLKKLEDEHRVFSHGDFNPGNLILDNHKLVAVIDFSFAGVSNELVDLTRLIGRCPKDFESYLTEQYEERFKTKIDKGDIDSVVYIWKYVEEKYILYIKQNHPSIVLPTLV